jgi:hypothetical protein
MKLITLPEFVNKYLGHKIDFDLHFDGQCVDLYRQYVKEVLGFPQSPSVAGAWQIWDSASPQYYEKVANTLINVPKPGDIMIWDKSAGKGFGHISVFIEGNALSFTSFDQNWPTLSVCTKTKHNYLFPKVIGWLHPKGGSMPGTLPKNYDEIVHGSTEWDKTVTKYLPEQSPKDASFDNLQKVVAGIQSTSSSLANQLQDVTDRLAIATQEIENRKEQVSRLTTQLVEQDKMHKAEITALKSGAEAVEVIKGQYEGRLSAKQQELDQAMKDKGTALNQLAACQSNQSGSSVDKIQSSALQWIQDFLSKFLNK